MLIKVLFLSYLNITECYNLEQLNNRKNYILLKPMFFMSFGIGRPEWEVQLERARNPFPSFEPEWEVQLRNARNPIQLFSVSSAYLENCRHGPTGYIPSEPTLAQRLIKADEEWDIHRLETGRKLLSSGMPPQFAWEENALSFTERTIGVKRKSTEQYIPTSVFPPEEITGFKTRVNQSLRYQGIEPLVPDPRPSYKLKSFLEPEQESLLERMWRERLEKLEFQKTLRSLIKIDSPAPEPLIPKLPLPWEGEDPESRLLAYKINKRTTELSNSKYWEVNSFSGVSPPFTTKRGTTEYPGTDLWSKTIRDGSYLIGEKGSGTHTHMGVDHKTGKDFVSIKDETKKKSLFFTFLENIFSL